jgi:MraZ protein
MFLGTYTPKLDDKGRLTLPAKFRDAPPEQITAAK